MRDRGLVRDDGWLSDEGRRIKQRVEARTDDLAAAPYDALDPGELDGLAAYLESIKPHLDAAAG